MTYRPIKIVNQTLPAVAVQALYHAATGKTENLSKLLRKKYIIRKNDLDQLYAKICQQIEHYDIIGGPTVTISLNFESFEHQRFSSWERFKIFDIGKSEIIKNIVLKFEFIIQILEVDCAPNINTAQRYIIDVDIDSELSAKSEPEWVRDRSVDAFINDFPPCSVSIDYVDYIIAKNILNTIEEWFVALEETKNPAWVLFLARFIARRPIAFVQLGYIGAALFLFFHAFWRSHADRQFSDYYTVSITLIVFVATSVSCRELFELFNKKIIHSVVPCCVLLTVGDERAYQDQITKMNSIIPTLVKFSFGIILSLMLNIVASYFYAYLTR